MSKLIQLVGDTSGGNWTDYRGAFIVRPSIANGTNLTPNSHHVLFSFDAPAEWRANNQRAAIIGHVCARFNEDRRPYHAWATGGINKPQMGVCGCAVRATATMGAGPELGNITNCAPIEFMIDVLFSGAAATTSVAVRIDEVTDWTFYSGGNNQSLLLVVPTDERYA